MDVSIFEQCGVNPEFLRLALEQTKSGLSALLHHLTELPGQDEFAAARQACGLDEQDVPADWSPRQPGGDARNAGALRNLILEASGAEYPLEVSGIEGDRSGL